MISISWNETEADILWLNKKINQKQQQNKSFPSVILSTDEVKLLIFVSVKAA